MEVKFKRLHPDARIPEKTHNDDFCYDCYAVWEKEVAPNVWQYGLGFALELVREDEGFSKGKVLLDIDGRPRSSIWKTGMVLANSTATIDESYRGEIMATFYHIMPNMPRYKVGDKILQIMLNVTMPLTFKEVDELTETERGDGGFGSTGK